MNLRRALIDPDDGQIRTLWNGGIQLDAILSPDGTRLYVTFIEDTRHGVSIFCRISPVPVSTLIRWIFPSTPGMAISPDGAGSIC
jgi:hypothetical protein